MDEFFTAYDRVLARWPVPPEEIDLGSRFGRTRVHACGPRDGTPLVLLHGSGATGTVWFANIAALSRVHRVYAIDQIGEPGRSEHNGAPITGVPDLMSWLDTVFDALGLGRIRLCGHSNGAWLALNYALHRPDRTDALALLDPTRCFTGLSPRYLLHALPLLRATAERVRAFLDWETGSHLPDRAWVELYSLGATDFPASTVVIGRLPGSARLRTLTMPVLLALAEHSRAHDLARVGKAAHALADVRMAVVPGVSHHGMPMENADDLNRVLTDFLT